MDDRGSSEGGRAPGVYRWLLGLYPPSFRERFADDATELFVDRLEDARSAGRIAVAVLWVRTVVNVVVHGILERLLQLRAHGVGDAFSTLRHALRQLRRSPLLSGVVVLTLALGIGANVALFGLIRSVLLQPLPYPDADELVQLWETGPDPDAERLGPSPLNFVDWAAEAESFESATAWYLTSGTYRTEEWVEEIRSAQVTADFFRTLGVEPLLGRGFRAEEVTGYGPVVLSYGMWQRLFGGDPTVVGRSIVSSGNSYEIVGVMPPDFHFPDPSVETWVAWSLPAVYAHRPETRTWRFLNGTARLRDQGTVESAQDELSGIAASLEDRYPGTNRGWGAAVTSLHDDTVGGVKATLWLAFAAVGLVLLVACTNVANLLLARVPKRMAEVGLRQAMGATRGRIARELLAENLILGGLAAVVGLGVGAALLEGLVALDAGGIPRLSEVRLDASVFAFAAMAGITTSVLFGAAPLVQLLSSRTGASFGLRVTSTRGHVALREAFVGTQTAFAVVLLAGAALFATSLTRVRAVDPGIDPAGVATFRVSLDPLEGGEGGTVRYYDALLDAVRSVPGIASAGAAQTLPLDPVAGDFRRPYRAPGSTVASGDAATVQMRIVTPGYPETMGMTILEGETLPDAAGTGGERVALVNETLARTLWPDGRRAGEVIEIDFREGWMPYRVVGIVRDVKHYGLRAPSGPEVYLAHHQIPYLAMSIVARTSGDPEASFGALRQAVLDHRPVQPPHNFVSMEALVGDSMAEERFFSVLFTVLSAIGLTLASTGIYGVIAYWVSHRRREIGIRMAVGAEPARVVGAIVRRALLVSGAGLVVGLLAVWTLGGWVEGLLFGVSPTEPAAVLGVAVVLAVVSALAAWMPARRAAWIPPSDALRAE